MVDAGRLPPLGPAAMFMVKPLPIIPRKHGFRVSLDQAVCYSPFYFVNLIVSFDKLSNAARHKADAGYSCDKISCC